MLTEIIHNAVSTALRNNGNQLESPWMNVKQIAVYLCTSERTIRKLVTENKIPLKRLTADKKSKILFHRREIDVWILNRNRKPTRREKEKLMVLTEH